MSRATHLVFPISTLLLLMSDGLFGQASPTIPTGLLLEHNTPVKLQFAQTISSAQVRKGDRLNFVVVSEVAVGGFTLISAGTEAAGSVIGVRKKRPLGIGGKVIIELDSVELTNGGNVDLVGRREFKGNPHTIRMGVAMAITGAIYPPAVPLFLILSGRDRTVLKGTEVTAYTKNDSWLGTSDLPVTRATRSELADMVQLLPPRSLNGEGREGDMLNLIFAAKEDDLQEAFAQAGWLKVEKSKPRIIWHLLWQRKRYTKLPMGRLYVFGRAPDFSYALPEPKSIVARRHHLRIWKTGGSEDGIPLWVAAATHDVGIQVVKRRFRLLHRIDPNVDEERDFIAASLAVTRQLVRQTYMNRADPVFRAETATGQSYYSDSRMLLLELRRQASTPVGITEVAGKLP
jgi:LssY C-terminus